MFIYPLVILGGFLSSHRHYVEMKTALERATGQRVYIVPTTFYDWLRSISASGWTRILNKLERTIQTAHQESGSDRVVLIGHSSGGVIGRLFLSPKPFQNKSYAGIESVHGLITLGSPNQNHKGSPMRRMVDRLYPGAFFYPDVRYISVAGSAVNGKSHGSGKERSAFRSYKILHGKGQVWGDGLVPLPSALLDGAHPIILEGIYHDFRKKHSWYGSTDAVLLWWKEARILLE